jgi:iron complex transport system ATP-binding protein
MRAARWILDDVSFEHTTGQVAVAHVSLGIASGAFTAILGPNGAGKSTLLQLLVGTLRPTSGRVLLDGRSVREWSQRDLARAIGVVPQAEAESAFTVREIVAMGRYPHLGAWQRERDVDRAAIERAMDRCAVSAFGGRWISTLSGGERQRVRLARALAQEPSTLVLDEPTTFLDISHEMTAFELLHRLRTDGATVVVVTHNINLAARYADELVLMDRGRVVAHGTPGDVLRRDRISAVYAWPVTVIEHAGAPHIVPEASAR